MDRNKGEKKSIALKKLNTSLHPSPQEKIYRSVEMKKEKNW